MTAAATSPHWHAIGAAEASQVLATDPVQGLAGTEAESRLAHVGPNLLQEGRQRGPWRILLDQFTDFMILVLLAAAVVSGLIGDLADTVVILVIVLLAILLADVAAREPSDPEPIPPAVEGQ